jgi:hypothetical protein
MENLSRSPLEAAVPHGTLPKCACSRLMPLSAVAGVAIVEANAGKQRALYFGVIENKAAMRPSSCLVAIREQAG